MNDKAIISINGLDNIGKTTHVDLLKDAIYHPVIVPSLHNFNKDTWEHLPDNWWFNSNTEDHVKLIYGSNVKRYEFTNTISNNRYILDRGAVMFKDVCIATCMLKEGLDENQASLKVESFSSKEWNFELSEFKILLLYSKNIQESVISLLARQENYSEEYLNYQTNLYTTLKTNAQKGVYDFIIYTKNKSIIEVQNLIRIAINKKYNTNIKLLFQNVKTIWAIGGLSECGKSYLGEYLRKKHNFIRLKIGYLIERGAFLEDIPLIYENAENIIRLFIRNLDIFSSKNRDFENYVVESLHRIDFGLDLKKFFGEQLKIVYIDVPLNLRIQRSSETEHEIFEKDKVKIERGAKEIANIADIIIENNYSIIAFENQISSSFIKFQSYYKPETISFNNLPVSKYNQKLELIFNDIFESTRTIKLLSIIGSAYEGNWMPEWSDLDIFIIGDGSKEVIEKCRNLYRKLSLTGIKSGITLITMEEIYSDILTDHVKNNIQKIYSGKIKPIYLREDVLLPNLEKIQFNSMSRVVFAAALIAIRRLIISDWSNIRQIYKHIILLLKILCDDYQNTNITAKDLQNKFNTIYNYNLTLPSLTEIIEWHHKKTENKNLTYITTDFINFIQQEVLTLKERN